MHGALCGTMRAIIHLPTPVGQRQHLRVRSAWGSGGPAATAVATSTPAGEETESTAAWIGPGTRASINDIIIALALYRRACAVHWLVLAMMALAISLA